MAWASESLRRLSCSVAAIKELSSITVTFGDRAIECSVKYTHGPDDILGSAVRTVQARRMAVSALQQALDTLSAEGAHVEWGGYATDYITTQDRILVERKREV
jgi:hypothetical protein